jgi:tRNA modification GTPase
LVSATPGTTRDYLTRQFSTHGVIIELIDTAGWQDANDSITLQAQNLGRGQFELADLVLLCLEAGAEITDPERRFAAQSGLPDVVRVATKCDLATAPSDCLATSAVSGLGLEALHQLLAERGRSRPMPSLAPSSSRCRQHVNACLTHLRQAHRAILEQDPVEILALELRCALDELGELVGAVYSDDLLDRIFSRFCIGK